MRLSLSHVALASVLIAFGSATAAEKWADPKLTVQAGLQLWLDAARATGAEPPPADGRLAGWSDASGHQRHLTQEFAEKRPLAIKLGEAAIVRFDGVDDHLRAVKQEAELKALTIFLVAAPRQNGGAFRGFMAFNRA